MSESACFHGAKLSTSSHVHRLLRQAARCASVQVTFVPPVILSQLTVTVMCSMQLQVSVVDCGNVQLCNRRHKLYAVSRHTMMSTKRQMWLRLQEFVQCATLAALHPAISQQPPSTMLAPAVTVLDTTSCMI
jgi:hypothetical protein